jgi:ribosome-binding protein aMBF1 (putative translation factor)
VAFHKSYPRNAYQKLTDDLRDDDIANNIPLGGYYQCGRTMYNKRSGRGWDLKKASDELGIPVGRLRRIEAGEARPSFMELKSIKTVYHIGAAKLGLDDSPM